MFTLLSWRIRTRFSKIGEGTFQCGRCQSTQPFIRRVGRRWVHLSLLPVFPVSALRDEHVRCETCKSKYAPEVLGRPAVSQPGA